MKVCLVRPPSIINPASIMGNLVPPLGLAYIAASLREAGFEVSVVDGIGEDPMQSIPVEGGLVLRGLTFEETLERVPSDVDLLGFSGMMSSEYPFFRPLAHLLSDRFPDVPLIAGGEHFTAAAKLSMEQCPGISAVAMGEGEETMVDVARTLSEGGSLESVPGLVVRSNGDFVSTESRRRIRDIDHIPLPAWDLVPLRNYLRENLSFGVDRGRSMPMLASRGCPYECTFCSNPLMWGRRWLARDPKLVVDEIEAHLERYDIDNVDFYDLTAIVVKKWIMEFCQELIDRDIQITWQLPSGTRSEAIDREVSSMLYRSGCRNLSYAPESGSERTLVVIKKKIKLDRLVESLRGAVAENLNIKINIILGLPDETAGDILKTIWLLLRLSWHGAHDVGVGAFAPYPGTELYDELVAEGRISHSDEFFRKLAYVDISETESYCRNVSSRWLRFYIWLAFAVFYGSNFVFRPQRIWKTVRNLKTGRHESRGEMALARLFDRLKAVRRSSDTQVTTSAEPSAQAD